MWSVRNFCNKNNKLALLKLVNKFDIYSENVFDKDSVFQHEHKTCVLYTNIVHLKVVTRSVKLLLWKLSKNSMLLILSV